jgi:hypothetical protein
MTQEGLSANSTTSSLAPREAFVSRQIRAPWARAPRGALLFARGNWTCAIYKTARTKVR